MHALASRASKSLQRMEMDRARDNWNSDCKATFRVGADNNCQRASPSWPPRRGSPPAIENMDDPFPNSRQNEKPISEILTSSFTELGMRGLTQDLQERWNRWRSESAGQHAQMKRLSSGSSIDAVVVSGSRCSSRRMECTASAPRSENSSSSFIFQAWQASRPMWIVLVSG
jgi:hypothetical protein